MRTAQTLGYIVSMADLAHHGQYGQGRSANWAPAFGGCPGCLPCAHAECACCGAPAVVASEADALHSCSWCARCWAAVLRVRQEGRGQTPAYQAKWDAWHPLRWWRLAVRKGARG